MDLFDGSIFKSYTLIPILVVMFAINTMHAPSGHLNSLSGSGILS